MEIEELINYWFSNEKLWFNASPEDDQKIKEKYFTLLRSNIQLDLMDCDFIQILGYILLHDQVARHIYRNQDEMISSYHAKALTVSLHCLEKELDIRYQPRERIFILLPLRHTFQEEFIQRAIDRVKLYRTQKDSPYYARFYKASIYSLSELITEKILVHHPDPNVDKNDILNILDKKSPQNLTLIPKIEPDHLIYRAFLETLRKLNKTEAITVSLSGGVDSMVSLTTLHQLSQNQQKFRIVAVMINYNNRDTACWEAQFVSRWCQLLEIDLYVRVITEIHRSRTEDRHLYEKITRKFRFDMYRRFGYPVILGHNLDDCIENIFSNIKKDRNHDDLRGMQEFVTDRNCLLVRPMLDIPKSEIVKLAMQCQIPFLEDSTPKWSERGRMRDHLVPFLHQFDKDIIPGLIKMVHNQNQMHKIYLESVNQFYAKIYQENNQIIIPLPDNCPEKRYGYIFWKDIIRKICVEHHLKIPTNKFIKELAKRIENNSYGKINLSNQIVVVYFND